jgi:A/G-specific adenine glycosylase
MPIRKTINKEISQPFQPFNELSKDRFIKTIWKYYRTNRRDFPWRNTQDPYRIIVSEIMLQQTQALRVVDKYLEFIKAFPNFEALHTADLHEVLKKWQGLGYNRRAIALKKIAEEMVRNYREKATGKDAEKGRGRLRVPLTLEELDALPGIGKATAASISAFAFNIAHPFIETNIRRVFIHFFFQEDIVKISDDQILLLVEATLDRKNPREWYFALMDYGAMLKKTLVNPNRRSKHYVRQSTFIGSNREVRGAILRLVTEFHSKSGLEPVSNLKRARNTPVRISEKELIGQLPFDKNKITANIESLSVEGFFVRKDGFIFHETRKTK